MPATETAGARHCIILENGNKLCGDDATSYCDRFVSDGTDAKTAAACVAAGSEVLSDAEVQDNRGDAADAELRQVQYDEFIPAAMGAESEHYTSTTEAGGSVTVNLSAGESMPLYLPALICSALRGIEGAPLTAAVKTSTGSIPCES